MSTHSNPGHPGEAAALSAIWKIDEKKALRKKLLEAFVEDPEISDSTNISVTFDDTQMKELHLIGTVDDEKSLKRAEELARENSGKDITVVNDLIVE